MHLLYLMLKALLHFLWKSNEALTLRTQKYMLKYFLFSFKFILLFELSDRTFI